MDLRAIDELLQRSLAVPPLSRHERQGLEEAVQALGRDSDGDRDRVAQRAFEMAREALGRPDALPILDWLEEVVKVLRRPPVPAPNPTTSEAHFSPGEDCPRRIIQLFAQARGRIDVCVFTITDDRISEAILDAHRRGIAVRVITDNEKATDEGSDVYRLEQAGVPLLVDRTEYHMHHKFALFDQAVLLTGSFNWTRGASRFNNENLIVTTDRRLIDAFNATFARLWERLGPV